jgi:prophage regulatory protein
MEEPAPTRLLKISEVQQRTSLDASTIRRMLSRGDFVSPVQLSPSRIAFRERDVEAWIASRQHAGATAAAS